MENFFFGCGGGGGGVTIIYQLKPCQGFLLEATNHFKKEYVTF
jgi:hypothetical protein